MNAALATALLPTYPAPSVEFVDGDGVFEGGIVPKLLAAVHAAKHGLVAEIGETAVLA